MIVPDPRHLICPLLTVLVVVFLDSGGCSLEIFAMAGSERFLKVQKE